MKTKSILTVAGVCFASLGLTLNAHADIGGANPFAGFTPDRQAPNLWSPAGAFLTIGISSADHHSDPPNYFYNTQGESRAINPTSSGSWSVTSDLYISLAMTTGSAGKQGNELWVSTAGGGYYAMSFLSGVAARSQDAATSSSYSLASWNDVSGLWSYVSAPTVNVNAYNQLSINYDLGSDVMSLALNGVTMFTQTGISVDDPNAGTMNNVYIQGYNLGDSYTSQWSNLSAAPVPEPSAMAISGLGGISLLAINRFRRKKQ